MKRLTVHVVSDVPLGAYHHYCAQLCNELVKHDDVAQVRLVTIFGERKRSGVAQEEMDLLDPRVSMEVLGPGAPSKARRYQLFFKTFLAYLWRLRRYRPDVVHVQTPTGIQLIDLFLLLVYRGLGISIVRTVHEPTAAERIKFPTALERYMGRLQLRLAGKLIVHDASTREYLLHWLGRDGGRVFIIPHGNYLVFRQYIPTEADDEEWVRFPGIPVILFLGIKRAKGLEVFIQALRQLRDDHYAIKPVIVGRVNPGDEDLIETLKQLDVAEVYPGYIPNAELWKFFNASDLVVLPYIRGTTSGGVHLAYAFKKPVIASDLECFKDLVIHGKTGLIVPKGDPLALANAIRLMCENREMRIQLGEEGFRQVSAENYQWGPIAEQTVQVYRQAVKEAQKGTSVRSRSES